MAKQLNPKTYLFVICTLAALGGMLFGLDQGFINGSLELIDQEFTWSVLKGETFASIMIYGCIVGAVLSGWIARVIGRKKTLIFAALFFLVFTIVGSLTREVFILFSARFCIGLAVGCASLAVPLYLSEIAPTKWRGGFISMYQLMITIGIFLIYLSNKYIGEHYHSWRLMLGIIAIPSFVMLIGSFFLPETPRWLMLKGRKTEAEAILKKTRETEEESSKEFAELEASMGDSKKKESAWNLIRKPYFIRVLVLGIFLQLLQQLSGINCIIYYSGQIFRTAGLTNPGVAVIVVGAFNMIATLVAVFIVDKIGRKPIMYFGLTVMTIALIVIGLIFHTTEAHVGGDYQLPGYLSWTMIVSAIFYIIAFAVSVGPIIWILCAEIFPLAIRDVGMAVTTLVNWTAAAVVVQSSLTVMSKWGGSVLFFAFALFCILGLFLVSGFVPETKGISLEQLEINLKAGRKLRKLGVSKIE